MIENLSFYFSCLTVLRPAGKSKFPRGGLRRGLKLL